MLSYVTGVIFPHKNAANTTHRCVVITVCRGVFNRQKLQQKAFLPWAERRSGSTAWGTLPLGRPEQKTAERNQATVHNRRVLLLIQ